MVRHPNLRVVAVFGSILLPPGAALAQPSISLEAFCDLAGAYMEEVSARRATGLPLDAAIDDVSLEFDALATSAEDLAARRRVLQWSRPLAVFAYDLGDLQPAIARELGTERCVARSGDVRLAPARAATVAMAAQAKERERRAPAVAAATAPVPPAVEPARRIDDAPPAASTVAAAADERSAAEERAAAERAAEERWAAQRAAQERKAAEERAAEERRVAEEQVAQERRIAEQQTAQAREAAQEQRAADERRAAEERRATERRAAEERRAARESAAADRGDANDGDGPESAVAQTSPERSLWGSVLQPFYEFAVAYGGDTIGSIEFANGDTQEIETGNGLTFAGGLIQRINEQFGIKYTAGYKVSFSAASNADVTKSVLPIDVVPYYRLGDHKIGAGLSLHLSPKVDWDWLGPTTDFDTATGITLEYAWRKFGFSYTDMDYKTEGISLDASHMSFKYSSKF